MYADTSQDARHEQIMDLGAGAGTGAGAGAPAAGAGADPLDRTPRTAYAELMVRLPSSSLNVVDRARVKTALWRAVQDTAGYTEAKAVLGVLERTMCNDRRGFQRRN
jgi:hypothetical protein